MARLTAAQIVQKWQANASTVQAKTYYTTGVNSPRRDWETETAAAEDAWWTGLTHAHNNNTRVKGVQAAGTSFWKAQTVAKAGNWQTGISNATTKATAGFTRLLNYLGQADATVAAMPRATRSERIARAAAYLTAVGAAKDADTSRT